MMRIGKLRHRVELQRQAENRDGYGQPIRSWATFATVWGSVEPLQGRELEHAKQITAETSHKITIRYQDSLNVENRVVYGDRIFDIEAILNPHERNEYLLLMCKEPS